MLIHREPTTRLSPDRLPTPPPHVSHLSDMGRRVGWVGRGVIGFRGFASEEETAHAAWVAYRAIVRRLAKTEGRRPMPVGIAHLTLARSGETERVMASRRPIATLVRPRPASRSGADSFGFEIRLPSPTDEVRTRAMADLAYRTLRKSGIRWSMWTGARDRIARDKRAAREAGEARLEREVHAATTPWNAAEMGRGARPTTGDTIPAVAIPTPAPMLDRGPAFLGIAILAPRADLDSSAVPAAPMPMPNGAPPRRGRRRELLVTASSITAVAFLLVLLRTPERVALALAGLGGAALLGRRLLATRAGRAPRRPVRVRPASEPGRVVSCGDAPHGTIQRGKQT